MADHRDSASRGPARAILVIAALALVTAAEVTAVVLLQGSATPTDPWYATLRLILAAATIGIAAAAGVRLRLRPTEGRRALSPLWPAALVAVGVALALSRPAPFVGWAALAWFTLSMLAVGIFGETLARGLILGGLLKIGAGFRGAALWSSAIFAAAHLVNLTRAPVVPTLIQVGYAFGIGLLLAGLRLGSGGLAAPIALHAALDWAFYFPSDCFVRPAGAPGAGQLAILLAVGTALGIVGLRLTSRAQRVA